jgi:hypothetical protein
MKTLLFSILPTFGILIWGKPVPQWTVTLYGVSILYTDYLLPRKINRCNISSRA